MENEELKQHKMEIAKAAELASKIITDQAAIQVKVIADAAAEALKVINKSVGADHDLLIRIETLMGVVMNEIKGLKDDTTKRIEHLEQNKLDCKESYVVFFKKGVENALDDADTRLKSLEETRAESKGKASVTLVLGAYIMSAAAIIVPIVLHFIK